MLKFHPQEPLDTGQTHKHFLNVKQEEFKTCNACTVTQRTKRGTELGGRFLLFDFLKDLFKSADVRPTVFCESVYKFVLASEIK